MVILDPYKVGDLTSKSGTSLSVNSPFQYRGTSSGAVQNGVLKITGNSFNLGTMSHRRLESGRWSGGGPFRLTKQTDMHSPCAYRTDFGSGNFRFLGQVYLGSIGSSTPAPPELLSDNDADVFGTDTLGKVTPNNPASDGATFLGETLQDIPALVGSSIYRDRALACRNAGDEYLNVEFGWLPMISDFRKFGHAVINSEKILSQYIKGSDTSIHRRLAVPGNPSIITGSGESYAIVPSEAALGNTTNTTYTHQTTETKWFEGSFRYYLPAGDTTVGNIRRYSSLAQKLVGWKVTPEVLWNVSPWSWAADWFGNVGSVMTNVSDLGSDGLVMEYGYVMCHRLNDTYLTAVDSDASGKTIAVQRNIKRESKMRRPATPYGFGFDLHGLSAKQTAILVALGLSRT